MLLETLSTHFRKARSTNTTDNGFPSRIPRIAEPTGIGDAAAQTTLSIFDLGKQSNEAQNAVIICPYAIGSNNNTFSMRVIGWRSTEPNPSTPGIIWIPVVLAEYLCTISSTPIGVAGSDILATELFADTIAIVGTTGNPNVSEEIVSPAADIIAHVVVDLKGFQKVELTFTTGGSATSCNALLALY